MARTYVDTPMGEFTAADPQIYQHYGSAIVARYVDLPDDGVTINGVTYVGGVRLEVYPGRTYATLDAAMVSRADQQFSWGTITDSARSKMADALKSLADELVITSKDDEWRREYVRERVRDMVKGAARSVLYDADREARGLDADTLVDAMSEARDVLLNLTEEDLRR